MVGGSVQSEFNDISLARYSLHLKEFSKDMHEIFSFSHSGHYGPVGRFTLLRLINPTLIYRPIDEFV